MSFRVIFYFAAYAMILMQTTINSVSGQCTTEGCVHDDLSMNIITEIQQQNVQAIGQQNKQIQNIHDVLIASFQQLTSQHDAILRSLQAVDRRLEEHDIYIKQGQSFQELLNASFQEMKNLQAIDRRSCEQDECINQVRNIYDLLNKSFQQMKSQFDDVDASLQTVDRNLENYQIDMRNQTQKSWKLVNDIWDAVVFPVKDCSNLKARGHIANGVYEVCVEHQSKRVCTNAYCDMETTNGTSLVFQRRKDGSVNFNRTWAEYRQGFGNPDGEFWLGNEMLHLLTSKRKYKLRVDLEAFNGTKGYAEYSTFSISSSSDNYRLTIRNYSGNAGDSLNYHSGKQFSTIDADNDGSAENGALKYGGGWWYGPGGGFYAKLNGIYRQRNETFSSWMGIHWYYFHVVDSVSLKSTEMKLVPVA